MSRSRSKWKLPYISPFLFRNKFLQMKSFNITNRKSIIPFTFLDKRIRIYNGKTFISIIVSRDKVGHKFGEFSITKVLSGDISKSVALKAERKRREKLLAKSNKKN